MGSTPSIGSGTLSGSSISSSSGSSGSTDGGSFTTSSPGGSFVFVSKEGKDSPLTSGSFYDKPGSGQYPIPSFAQEKPVGPISTGSGTRPSDKDSGDFGPGTGSLPVDGSLSPSYGI